MYIFLRRIAISLAVALLLVLFALRVSAGKQRSAPSSSDDDKQTASVEGTVVCAGTDEPLGKARVTLSNKDDKDRNSRVAVTGTDGKFMFKGVAPGSYDLNVYHDGYIPRSYGEDSEGKGAAILTLAAAQKMSDLLFRLQKCAAISGRILDEDGDPVRDAFVVVMRRKSRHGLVTTVGLSSAQTNDLGEYRVFDLPPGQYCVRVTFGDMERMQMRVGDQKNAESGSKAANNYVPTYYPNVVDGSRASVIELKSGDELSSIDIMLTRNRTYKIRGHITDLVGDNGQYGISAFSEGEWTPPSAGQIKNGLFEVAGLLPGKYLVIASGSVEKQDRRQVVQGLARVEVVDADLDSVNIVIKRGSDVHGRVLMEGNKALPKHLTIFLQLVDPDGMPGGNARVRADGTFELNVPDATYRIDAYSECAECYVKSAKIDGTDHLEKGVQIVGGISQVIEVVYSNRSGSVEGVVTKSDQLPATGVTVLLVRDPPPLHGKLTRFKEGTTDQYGHFTIRGVAPGKYKAFAFATAPGFDDFTDPEFIGPLESKGESVSIEENGKQTLQLKLIIRDPDAENSSQ
jgi:sarcosine oxidase gamma subunit